MVFRLGFGIGCRARSQLVFPQSKLFRRPKPPHDVRVPCLLAVQNSVWSLLASEIREDGHFEKRHHGWGPAFEATHQAQTTNCKVGVGGGRVPRCCNSPAAEVAQ